MRWKRMWKLKVAVVELQVRVVKKERGHSLGMARNIHRALRVTLKAEVGYRPDFRSNTVVEIVVLPEVLPVPSPLGKAQHHPNPCQVRWDRDKDLHLPGHSGEHCLRSLWDMVQDHPWICMVSPFCLVPKELEPINPWILDLEPIIRYIDEQSRTWDAARCKISCLPRDIKQT